MRGLAQLPYNEELYIKIDPDKTLTKDEDYNFNYFQQGRFSYTLKHEMLHILGFDDVYDTEHFYETSEIIPSKPIDNYITLLQNQCVVSTRLRMFTPADVSNLCLLYYNKHREVEEENKNTKLEEVTKFLNDYKLKFLEKAYNSYKNDIIFSGYPRSPNFPNDEYLYIIPDFVEFGTLKISLNYIKKYKYEIVLSNGKYKQIFTNKETGEQKTFINNYYKINEMIFLYNMYSISSICENFEPDRKLLGFLVMKKESNGIQLVELIDTFSGSPFEFEEILAEKTNITETQNTQTQSQNLIQTMTKNLQKAENNKSNPSTKFITINNTDFNNNEYEFI